MVNDSELRKEMDAKLTHLEGLVGKIGLASGIEHLPDNLVFYKTPESSRIGQIEFHLDEIRQYRKTHPNAAPINKIKEDNMPEMHLGDGGRDNMPPQNFRSLEPDPTNKSPHELLMEEHASLQKVSAKVEALAATLHVTGKVSSTHPDAKDHAVPKHGHHRTGHDGP